MEKIVSCHVAPRYVGKVLNVWMWPGGCRQGWLCGCFGDKRPVCGAGVFGRVHAVSVGQGSAYLLSWTRCVSGSWQMEQISPGVTCTRSLSRGVPKLDAEARPVCYSLGHTTSPAPKRHRFVCPFPHSRVVCEMLGLNTGALVPHGGSGWAVRGAMATRRDEISCGFRMGGKNKGEMLFFLDFAKHHS